MRWYHSIYYSYGKLPYVVEGATIIGQEAGSFIIVKCQHVDKNKSSNGLKPSLTVSQVTENESLLLTS